MIVVWLYKALMLAESAPLVPTQRPSLQRYLLRSLLDESLWPQRASDAHWLADLCGCLAQLEVAARRSAASRTAGRAADQAAEQALQTDMEATAQLVREAVQHQSTATKSDMSEAELERILAAHGLVEQFPLGAAFVLRRPVATHSASAAAPGAAPLAAASRVYALAQQLLSALDRQAECKYMAHQLVVLHQDLAQLVVAPLPTPAVQRLRDSKQQVEQKFDLVKQQLADQGALEPELIQWLIGLFQGLMDNLQPTVRQLALEQSRFIKSSHFTT